MLTLIGVDARQWLDEMDRPATTSWGCLGPTASMAGKRTVDQYFLKSNCLVCSAAIRAGNVFCAICVKQPLRSHMIFASRKRNSQQQRDQLLAAFSQLSGKVIFVSNEVGMGITPMGELTRRFVDESGFLHQQLASICDNVTLVVAGLPLQIKPTAAH